MVCSCAFMACGRSAHSPVLPCDGKAKQKLARGKHAEPFLSNPTNNTAIDATVDRIEQVSSSFLDEAEDPDEESASWPRGLFFSFTSLRFGFSAKEQSEPVRYGAPCPISTSYPQYMHQTEDPQRRAAVSRSARYSNRKRRQKLHRRGAYGTCELYRCIFEEEILGLTLQASAESGQVTKVVNVSRGSDADISGISAGDFVLKVNEGLVADIGDAVAVTDCIRAAPRPLVLTLLRAAKPNSDGTGTMSSSGSSGSSGSSSGGSSGSSFTSSATLSSSSTLGFISAKLSAMLSGNLSAPLSPAEQQALILANTRALLVGTAPASSTGALNPVCDATESHWSSAVLRNKREGTPFCPHCGARMIVVAKFCPQCGKAIPKHVLAAYSQ